MTSDTVRVDHTNLLSVDQQTPLAVTLWTDPQAKTPACIVQLVHGMAEHIERYDGFARFLVQQGYAVIGHDHVAHGKSVVNQENPQEEWGHLSPNCGAEQLIEDVNTVRLYIAEKYPNVPHILFGHSMGSFVVRAYIGVHGEGLTGVIICGTGWQNPLVLKSGKFLALTLAKFKGWKSKPDVLTNMTIGAYAKHFEGEEYPALAWLSRDVAVREKYEKDPACGFAFSIGGNHELFRLIEMSQDPVRAKGIPTNLPVLIISGQDDPVGDMGKAPYEVEKFLRADGLSNVEVHVWPGSRHELLNETNKDEVMQTINAWIQGVLS
ncbi:MAG: lysophospholipase [Coriobacteriales bacterium]|nr:lysophospholipase [Coriobacteriales bacterium]